MAKEEIEARLKSVLEAGVSDESFSRIKKQFADLLYEVETDLDYRLKEELAPNLVSFVAEMADDAVKSILAGNDAMMRQYLGCRTGHWTGRSDSPVWGRERDASEWHPVIHGELFLQGAVKLRRDIVAAHRELITEQRILDLEDQVNSLVAQVNKANAERDRMWERVRSIEPA
jgi:hypothetical protein